MDQNFLRTQHRNSLLNLHLVVVCIIASLELVFFFLRWVSPFLPLPNSRHALLFGVLLPIIINLCTHWGARLLVHKATSDTTKDSIVIYAAFITAACVAILHREHPLAQGSYLFPIVLCGFFNNKKLLNRVTLCALLVLTPFTVFVLLDSLRNPLLLASRAVDLVMAYTFVLISYFASSLAFSFSRHSFSALQTQTFLQQQIQLDPMTRLYNRSVFDRDLDLAVHTFERNGTNFCLAVIDIDNFKQINDTYGHDQGDEVLFALRDTLKAGCSPTDKPYRYGGEEFALIFPGKDQAQCLSALESMLLQFRSRTYSFTDTPFTFSCGLAQYPGSLSAEDFFEQVDELLYAAKKTGKNKIVSPAPDAI